MTRYEDRFEAECKALLARRAHPRRRLSLDALLRMDAMLGPGRLAGVLRDFVERRKRQGGSPGGSSGVLLPFTGRGPCRPARAGRRAPAGLGLLRDLWVLGPFDAQGRSGLERIYPAELALPDPRGSQCIRARPTKSAGAVRSVEVARQGAVMLGALLRPDNDAVAYLLAYLHSDKGRWAALRLGSPGPVKAWVNGRVVMSRDVVRSAGMDQDATVIWLPRGETVLLVKTVVSSGTWQLFLRVTDPEGRSLAGVTANAEPPSGSVTISAAPAHPPAVRDLREMLRRRAEQAPKAEAALHWLDFARVLDLLRSEDSESKAVELAAGRAASAESASSAARFAAFRFLGQVAREEDDARAALERALELAPGAGERALVLAELGDLAQRQHRPEAALQRWREAAAADPTSLPAQLALAGEERETGLYAAALLRLDALPSAARSIPAVLDAACTCA